MYNYSDLIFSEEKDNIFGNMVNKGKNTAKNIINNGKSVVGNIANGNIINRAKGKALRIINGVNPKKPVAGSIVCRWCPTCEEDFPNDDDHNFCEYCGKPLSTVIDTNKDPRYKSKEDYSELIL